MPITGPRVTIIDRFHRTYDGQSLILIIVPLAEVVSHAVDSLMEQLPNDEKPELDRPIPPPGEKVHSDCRLFLCTIGVKWVGWGPRGGGVAVESN